MTVSERVAEVRFTGASSRVAPLTWPQRTMWVAHHRLAPNDCALLNIDFVASAPNRSVTAVLADLRSFITMHEVLRSTYRVDWRGAVDQVCAETGVVTVRIVTTNQDSAHVAGRVRAELVVDPFDLITTFPLRIALVTVAEEVTHVVLVGHHIAFDGWSIQRLCERVAAGAVEYRSDTVRCLQPADQAAAEAAPDGMRVLASALDYWEEQLRTIPPALFPNPLRPSETPRFKVARMESFALAAVMPGLSRRYRVTTSTMLLAAVLCLLSVKTGHLRCGVQVSVANRDTLEAFEAVGCLYQEVMLSIDLTGVPCFSDALRHTWKAYRAAADNARYDPLALYALEDRVNAERGIILNRTCVFNDTRVAGVRPARTGRDGATEPPATALQWLPEQYRHRGGHFHLYVDDSARNSILLRLRADTTVLSSAEIRQFLLGVERLLLHAATEDFDLAEIPRLAAVTAPGVDPDSEP